MKLAPLWSVVVIARNEVKTLPRLVRSLKAFHECGGEILVLDTGSTDDTPAVARGLGCMVTEIGDKFKQVICAETARAINDKFCVKPDAPIVAEGDTLFDFSAARNWAASLASKPFISMPDCDEEFTVLNIDAINTRLEKGPAQLEYNFIFSHDSEGNPAVQFKHCKFYDRRWMEWKGIIHEVLQVKSQDGDVPVAIPPRVFCDDTVIKLEHWQNHETNRNGYLKGLAVDCYLHPENDRNSHYFARELMWSDRLASADKEFRRHVAINAWAAERAQSCIFRGDIATKLHGVELGLQKYFQAIIIDGGRREAFLRIAKHFYEHKDPQQTYTWAKAALTVGPSDYYGNNMADYRESPHEMAYWAAWNLGLYAESESHWNQALQFQPHNSKFLHDARFYRTLPKVGVVIPHISGTRENLLFKLREQIQERANYPDFEVIVEPDFMPPNRSGVATTFNRGVARTSAPVIMFLGDDCEVELNFLIEAVLSHLNKFRVGWGLTGLNDGIWNGLLATHWLANRDLPTLWGETEFLHSGYNHVGCDNELTARAKKLEVFNYCESAKIHNSSINDEVRAMAWNPASVEADRSLLCKRSAQFKFDLI